MLRPHTPARFAGFAILLLIVSACAGRLPLVPAGDPAWMWSGALTDASAVVKARIPGLTTTPALDVREATGATTTRIEGVRLRPDGDVFSFALADLKPSTTYSYEVAGTTPGAQQEGRLRTLPRGPGRFTVTFASCASTGSNARVWDTLQETDPDLFIHMGDFHYEDIRVDEPRRFRQAYDRSLMSPRQGAFYRRVPLAYVWDDHDFGGDESDARSPSSRAAHEVYREYVPHYALSAGDKAPIHQAFTMGRVRVLMTDVRTAREPADTGDRTSRSLLGQSQRDWLLAQLEDAADTAALVVWVNVVPWITKHNENTVHGWAPWAGEREQIAAALERLGLTRRLIILSGDAHMLALDDGTNSQYAPGAEVRGPVIMHAAPLDRWPRVKGGPYSHGTSARNQQFGVMTVDDDGKELRVVLVGRNWRNERVGRLHLELRCTADECR